MARTSLITECRHLVRLPADPDARQVGRQRNNSRKPLYHQLYSEYILI